MKTILIMLIALPLFLSYNLANAQTLDKNREVVIKSFISALFKEKKTPNFIIDAYLELSPNDTIPIKSREEAMISLMDYLKKKVSDSIALIDYNVTAYNDFTGAKKTFSGSSEDIFIVNTKNKPLIYFYLHNDKIVSFTLIEKGEYGYFIII